MDSLARTIGRSIKALAIGVISLPRQFLTCHLAKDDTLAQKLFSIRCRNSFTFQLNRYFLFKKIQILDPLLTNLYAGIR